MHKEKRRKFVNTDRNRCSPFAFKEGKDKKKTGEKKRFNLPERASRNGCEWEREPWRRRG